MSPQDIHLRSLADAAHYTLSLSESESQYAHLVLRELELEAPETGQAPTLECLALLAVQARIPGHVAARVYREMSRRLAGGAE